jgi:hypothetical protein
MEITPAELATRFASTVRLHVPAQPALHRRHRAPLANEVCHRPALPLRRLLGLAGAGRWWPPSTAVDGPGSSGADPT